MLPEQGQHHRFPQSPGRRGEKRRRRGSLTLELLLVLPILLLVLLAIIEFSIWAVAQQQLLTASREGARVAALGGSRDDVEQAVRVFLGGKFDNATIDAVLTDDQGQPVAAGQPVQVVVSLPATDAVPDLLPLAGFSIRGQSISAGTVMRKE
jgi:Flp pilus assembly protein TadG